MLFVRLESILMLKKKKRKEKMLRQNDKNVCEYCLQVFLNFIINVKAIIIFNLYNTIHYISLNSILLDKILCASVANSLFTSLQRTTCNICMKSMIVFNV